MAETYDGAFEMDGHPVRFRAGQSLAAALWDNGFRSLRRTRRLDRPRGLFCGIGVCHDCHVVVDGVADQRACLTPARSGLEVTTQLGQPVPAEPSPTPSRVASAAGAENAAHGGVERHIAHVAVVGAGPAGLAAAVAAQQLGAQVVLLDGEARPGGQYWRHGPTGIGPHHHARQAWQELSQAFAQAQARGLIHLARHRVWRADRLDGARPHGLAAARFRLLATRPVGHLPDGDEVAVEVMAGAVVLATGAHDRVRPFPGWDLPGVLTAGGAQALLKEHDVLAGRRVVVAGSGPFLLSLAAGLVEAGSEVVAVYEAADAAGWLRRWRAAVAVPGLVAEGVRYAGVLSRRRVPVRPRHVVLAARGRDRIEAVEVARVDGAGRVVPDSARWQPCDALAVGWGFVPRLELAQQLGCPVGASTAIGAAAGPAVPADVQGRTAVAGVFVAGEVGGVGGAALARLTGQLAGATAAGGVLGVPVAPDGEALARLRRLATFAAAMHQAHPVPVTWLHGLDDDTPLCRCEEVPAGLVREAVQELGAGDPRTAKLLTRCGMGWCQGRICGESLAALVAGAEGLPADADHRPITTPVRLATLAGLPEDATTSDEGDLR